MNLEQFRSYNSWDQHFNANFDLRPEVLWPRIHRQFDASGGCQLLWDEPLPYARENGYRLIFKTQGPVGPSGEVFFFYVPAGRFVQ